MNWTRKPDTPPSEVEAAFEDHRHGNSDGTPPQTTWLGLMGEGKGEAA